jgi:ubiquinone/menaquinone biosynthesis C-methylase UbiE
MSERLPFDDQAFDAVMSNVSAHMFSDDVTRSLFREARRVVRPSGLLLLHVNSDADRPLREARRPVNREFEPNYVLEESGQTSSTAATSSPSTTRAAADPRGKRSGQGSPSYGDHPCG